MKTILLLAMLFAITFNASASCRSQEKKATKRIEYIVDKSEKLEDDIAKILDRGNEHSCGVVPKILKRLESIERSYVKTSRLMARLAKQCPRTYEINFLNALAQMLPGANEDLLADLHKFSTKYNCKI